MPSRAVRGQVEDSVRCEFAAGAGKFLYQCGYRLSAALAPGPADYRKLQQLQAPCSLRSCFFVKGKRQAEKQWPGTALRQNSKSFRSISKQLCRDVVCEFPFFAFGEHYAQTPGADALHLQIFQL